MSRYRHLSLAARAAGFTLVELLVVILVIGVLIAVAAPSSFARLDATCTEAGHAAAQAKLAAYQKAMPKQRAAYFKKHKKKVQRAAFVKKQKSALARLRAAASCDVEPPPPAETVAPTLQNATVTQATIRLVFDEALASISSVSVTADGAPVAVSSAAVSGANAVITLVSPVDGGAVVLVTAVARDVAGNETALRSNAVTNTAAAGFSPALAKASWADQRDSESSPEFGEWPIDHTYFLPAMRVRVILLFVDFVDKKLAYTPKRIYDEWKAVTPPWYRLGSFGRFDFGMDYVDRVYQLPKRLADYGPVQSSGGGPLKTIITDAAALADADVDFSKYDVIWVVNRSGLGNRQLRTWPEYAFVLDGKQFLHANIAEDYLVNGTIIEENGHPVDNAGAAHQMFTHDLGHHYGLPDTSYKPDPVTPYDFTYVGGWDMQDNPAGMFPGGDYLAWNKWRLGWLDATQVRGLISPGTVEATVAPVETAGGVKMVVAQTTPTFLYAVEVRRHLGNDVKSTCDEGVLVYTVDSTKRNGLASKFVQAAKTATDSSTISTCGIKYAAPFDVGPGEVSTFENADVKVGVLATDGVNYRVRVTRK